MRRIIMLACLVLAGIGVSRGPGFADEQHQHAGDVPEKLGKVDFPVSCSEKASAMFQRGVALLHSFVYEEAEKGFESVIAEDPSCAMGYWGVAMTQFHPIWAASNPAAAPSPAELGKGSEAVARGRALGAKTPRENDYIAAVGSFYAGERKDYPARAAAFAAAMEQVAQKYPSDREASIFYALSLLGTAQPADKTYAVQKKSAAILNKLLPDAPEHPGIAHYLIHSLDYPPLAELALPAARAYSKIAPSSAHALHMPSHIFTRLGLWNESIASNLESAEAARRIAARDHQGASAAEELHALDYLVYAYLQLGRDKDAAGVLARVQAVVELDQPSFQAAYCLASVPARYALERRAWDEAASVNVTAEWFPWKRFPYAEAMTHLTRALGAAHQGKLDEAREAVKRLAVIQTGLVAANDDYWATQIEVQRRSAAAWLARAEGKNDQALELMRSAADLEDTSEKHPVTPGYVLPARELLGDLLIEMGQPGKALVEYETSMKSAPGRFNSLSGAGRAAARSGDEPKARLWYAKLITQCEGSEGTRAGLVEARAYAAAHPAPAHPPATGERKR